MYEKDAADDLFVDNSIDCICGHYALHGRSSNPGTGYDDVMDYGARIIDSAETLYNFMYSAS